MTEADLLAERARVALLHLLHPIPPGVALDMVMDATGDRDAALRAIRGAFAGALGEEMPEQPPTPGGAPPSPNRVTACVAVTCLRLSADRTAELCVREVRSRTYLAHVRAESPAERDLAADWLSWCACAEHDLKICRALTEAANPIGAV